MKRFLNLGGVTICLDADRPLKADPAIAPFRCPACPVPDVTVRVTWDWLQDRQPAGPPVGEDLVQTYYQEGETLCCELAGGDRGPLARTWYTPDCRRMVCTVNNVTCPADQDREGQILRMLPVRQIFQRFGVLFLHAAQIACQGKGILFSAPSGTGKTTQAQLWQQCRGAELICNDRTLLRQSPAGWQTYGYPLDGSAPVRSHKIHRLGCVVILAQGMENRVETLGPAKAAGLLMGQVVIDSWSGEARQKAMEQILVLLEQIPVLLLTCTPDERAVRALEQALMDGKVIANGNNF